MIRIRVDDVLLVNPNTGSMKISLRNRSYFDYFQEADKLFAQYNIPCILAILAEGIDVYPEWVEYIKKNKHRFIIEMHGWHHSYYVNYTEEEGYQILKNAKDKIEKTFNVKVGRWIVPHGKHYFPSWIQPVMDRLGLKINNRGIGCRVWVLHYWNTWSIDKINKLILRSSPVAPSSSTIIG